MTEIAVAGKLIAERYRLEHQVGEGGMATVWVAEDEKLERWVALKLLGSSYLTSSSVRQRFEREAVAIAKLRSPHVVQVFDHGTDVDEDGQEIAYIAMELLSGQDLYTWLKTHRPVTLRQVARIVSQVARGLAVAHRAGIVHRDLKPANVFVVRDHDEDSVKVFDFGLARGFRDHSQLRELRDRTGEGVLLGTPRYMSPEQAHGARTVDHRGDLWSLAVITYLAITGRLPFDGTGVGEVVTKISTEQATPPSALVDDLPAAIDAFFVKGLAKDPDQRFQSAADFALALDAAIGDGSTSSDLEALMDDTEVELTRQDTHVGDVGPPDSDSGDAATVLREPPPRSTRGRNTVAAAITLAAGVAVLAVSLTSEGTSQTTREQRIAFPDQRRASEVATANANDVRREAAAASSPTAPDPVVSSKRVTPPAVAAASASPAAPSASAEEPLPSDRGLELFDDRH